MASRQFVQNDSDLLGLLKQNNRQAVRELQKAFADEGGIATNSKIDELKQEAVELRDELLTSLDAVNGSIDTLEVSLVGNIEATSSMATLVENMRAVIEASALRIQETYEYAQSLETAEQLFQTSITGTICRGYINDPGGGSPIFGIAIAENLSFTGQERTESGLTYYELAGGQTLGLYTSTGWQFWINGNKVGWFDSADGMLHTVSQVIEHDLQIGSWKISPNNGYGIKYVG